MNMYTAPIEEGTILQEEEEEAWAAPFRNKTCQQLEQVYNSMRN